jgi:hypothetical protein
MNEILLKRKNGPILSSELVDAEIGIDYANNKIYYKKPTGALVILNDFSSTFEVTLNVPIGYYHQEFRMDSKMKSSSKPLVMQASYKNTDENFYIEHLAINIIPGNGNYEITLESTNNQKFGGIIKLLITR